MKSIERIGFGIALAVAVAPSVYGATWTVLNVNDDGFGSLRWAVQDANLSTESDNIVFSPTVAGTIVLTSPLSTAGTIVINGPGAARVSVSGNDASRVFVLGSGVNLTVNDLTICNGRSPGGTGSYGGGVYMTGATATFNRCVVRNNVAGAVTAAYGGGIYAASASTVALNDCTVHANSVTAATFGAAWPLHQWRLADAEPLHVHGQSLQCGHRRLRRRCVCERCNRRHRALHDRRKHHVGGVPRWRRPVCPAGDREPRPHAARRKHRR